MYSLYALAQFSFSECERFLDGDSSYFGGAVTPLSDADARLRIKKADGGEMNGISWTVGHMAWQWVRLATRAIYARDYPHLDGKFGHLADASDEPLAGLRQRVYRYRSGTEIPPDPPPIEEVRQLLREACVATDWLMTAGPDLLASRVNARDTSRAIAGESIGKNVVRAVLHTFTHSGEILAVRQILGHPEVSFLKMHDLEWPGEVSMSQGANPASVNGN